MKLEYRNYYEKSQAFESVRMLAQFLKDSGHSENASRLEENVCNFICQIPVKNQNPCKY